MDSGSEIINGYTLCEPFHTQEGGNCEWTFARKNGKIYFIKKILELTYPRPEASMSEKIRKKKIAQCEKFQDKNERLYAALRESNRGNLVVPIDFFLFDGRFYVVTEKVDRHTLDFSEVYLTNEKQRIILMKVLAYEFGSLAAKHIIHSDVKPENLLLKRTEKGYFTVKIIDFGESFFESEPPPSEALKGDQVYYSPEFVQAIRKEEDGYPLTPKSDIFSLGIIFHEILSGEKPDTGKYHYLCEAVLNDEEININKAINEKYHPLLRGMLAKSPEERYSTGKIFKELRAVENMK